MHILMPQSSGGSDSPPYWRWRSNHPLLSLQKTNTLGPTNGKGVIAVKSSATFPNVVRSGLTVNKSCSFIGLAIEPF